MSGFSEYDRYDGLGLAALVRAGDITPLELVEEAISRIERLNPQLNAVVIDLHDKALEVADKDLPEGPFRGVPFLLKDSLAVWAGTPTQIGSRLLSGFVPDHSSELVQRFQAAGLIFIGKTNTPEFGLAPVTEPALYGPAKNPWDLARTPGGSSGGSAAAVAARMVPLSHGSDGGGSIRIPASCCAVFGLKPTRGRNPVGPDRGDAWHGLVCDHVLTRSVRDSAAVLDAIAGPDVGAPYYAVPPQRPFLTEVDTDPGKLRIAFTAEPLLPSKVDIDCVHSLEQTAVLCQELGHEVEEASPNVDGEAFAQALLTMVCGETCAALDEVQELIGRRARVGDVEPSTFAAALMGSHIRAGEFSRAVAQLKRSGREVGHFFEHYDVLLTPTLATLPLVAGALQFRGWQAIGLGLLNRLRAGRVLRLLAQITGPTDSLTGFASNTSLFNATGQPAMSVPLCWSETGLPIGMQFVGRYGDESTLFRLAGQLERAKPWFDAAPPICAL